MTKDDGEILAAAIRAGVRDGILDAAKHLAVNLAAALQTRESPAPDAIVVPTVLQEALDLINAADQVHLQRIEDSERQDLNRAPVLEAITWRRGELAHHPGGA